MDRMVKKPEVLAVIPARGGSKGIPRKNIKLFAGYPLIAYSIAAGLQSELTTRVIVSTDDEEIAEVAERRVRVHEIHSRQLRLLAQYRRKLVIPAHHLEQHVAEN